MTTEAEAFERMIAEEYAADDDDSTATLPPMHYIRGWLDAKSDLLSAAEAAQVREWLRLALAEAERLRAALAERPVPQQPAGIGDALTAREIEVYRYMRNTLMTVGEIAGTLYVSSNTIKTHCKNIYRKLNVQRRGQLRGLPNF